MPNGIYTALSGALAQETLFELSSNNLANVETAGFRGQKGVFKEVLAQYENEPPNASQRMVKIDEVVTDFEQGRLVQTDRPLDTMILGDGFYAVDTPDGERYTRSGVFSISAERKLVDMNGYPIVGNGGPIEVPEGESITIAENGTISAGELEIGRLKVVQFEEQQKLQRFGHNLFVAPPEIEPVDVEFPTLRVGVYESSNVNVIREMTEIVKISRGHEAFQRCIETFRATDRRTATDLGR